MNSAPNYAVMAVPPPISSFDQQKFGGIEVDASGDNSMIVHGTFMLDGQITSSASYIPAVISLNNRTVSVSGSTINLVSPFIHTPNVSTLFNPTFSGSNVERFETPLDFYGHAVFVTPVQNASGSTMMCLCLG
uniref:Uncharacterized protein n=1 Tax=viral metagenome TaxID=1070528 RepID=A0A6C0CRP2_9ZZZZ